MWRFVADTSEPRADRLIDELIKKFQEIADQPLLLGSNDEMFGSGNRTSLAGDYIIFYVVAAGGIEIIRVIHGARDIEAMSPF
ncbi:MAG TPA: type II toxin-antitoxin system RelE/ParE family toxin [Gemmataceae bacterium]|nr:type II toxin-antitoxin system RelE/ParE family toxin [Gemmataceae bacterium]